MVKIIKTKQIIFSFLLIVSILISNMTVLAKEDGITKSYEFTSTDLNETKDEKFSRTVQQNKKVYELKSIDYELVNKNPIITEKKVEKILESDYIKTDEEYMPEKNITEDGITYKLKSQEPMDESPIQAVTGYTDYDHMVSASGVPVTKEILAVNNRTGRTESVTCDFNGITQLEEGEWIDTYIDITFISYESEYFEWQGIEVTKDNTNPLRGYEQQLLASVGAAPDEYRIINTFWLGEPYDHDGTLCRDARATVQRYVQYYRASYNGTIKQKTKYKLTYEGTQKVDSKTDFNYKIKAVAKYKEVEKTPIIYYVLIGVGIILAIGLIVLLLYLLAKRKKEEKEEKIQVSEKIKTDKEL